MTPFLKSFIYAFKGIALSLRQRNMKIHVVCAIIAICFGIGLSITSTEWCFILLCIGAVLSLEIVNTAIEHLVDIISPEYNEKAGKVKDLAAGAVLVFAILSAIIGVFIFGKHLLVLLSNN